MSLLELKEYLQSWNMVSMQDLSLHFKTAPETLEPMLEHWICKGKLRREISGSCCGGKHGTCSCGDSKQIWYLWIE